MTSSPLKPTLKRDQVLAGRYRIDTVLARGGFSFVYLARREPEGDVVVVKVLHHDAMRKDPAAAERFKREAGIARGLRHPHHVTVFDFGATPDGQPFLVLERLHGRELSELFEHEAPLPDRKVRTILRQILLGLAELHRNGIAHRDLKPPNVFVCDTDDGGIHIKLIDYGLAKILSAEHPLQQANLTVKDIVVGTPGYLAPELLLGASTTTLVDLYAVGIIGYELLLGRRAYEGTLMDRAVAQSQGNPAPAAGLLAHSPLWPVIDRLLERRPEDRYQTADEAIAALDALELVDPAPLRSQPTGSRGRRAVALVVGLVIALAALAAWFLLGAR